MKEMIMKAKVCQKVTSKWLEHVMFSTVCYRNVRNGMFLTVCKIMSVCTEGLFSFSD